MNETPTASSSLLEIRNLAVEFDVDGRRVHAVRDMTYEVKPREFVALVGRSGSGKSVSLFSTLGLVNDPPGIVDGSITFDGEPILPDPAQFAFRSRGRTGIRSRSFQREHRRLLESILGRRIGLVLQDPYGSLVPHRTVMEHLIENLHYNRPEWKELGFTRIAHKWLERVGFTDPGEVMGKLPGELSGGMCQRVMLAMVMSAEPSLILADEPTSALDATIQLEVLELFARINREEGVAILLVTHDIGVALRYASRVVVVSQGSVVDQGEPERFLAAGSDISAEAKALIDAEHTLRASWSGAGRSRK